MSGPKQHHLFTSESVTEGHPDKICDQISDAVLDAVLTEDPLGRVACEAVAKDQDVYVVGEVRQAQCSISIHWFGRRFALLGIPNRMPGSRPIHAE